MVAGTVRNGVIGMITHYRSLVVEPVQFALEEGCSTRRLEGVCVVAEGVGNDG